MLAITPLKIHTAERASEITTASVERPALIWLHGLLGSGEEWRSLAEQLPEWNSWLVDLPGHGASVNVSADSFAQVSACLTETLNDKGISCYWLIGYSLGARIAMYYACHAHAVGLQGIIVEGGNPGLRDEKDKQQRREHDAYWANRLRNEPPTQVLNDWYQQPVFASLTNKQRTELVSLRSHNRLDAVAAMLEATSLGVQPWFGDQLHQLTCEYHYLCGEKDNKFRQLAELAGFMVRIVPHAGHNAHRENPVAFLQQLRQILAKSLQ